MFGLREKNKEILPLKKLENSTLEHCEYGLGKCPGWMHGSSRILGWMKGEKEYVQQYR